MTCRSKKSGSSQPKPNTGGAEPDSCAKRLGLRIAGPEVTLYLNNAFTEENIRMEAAVQVLPVEPVDFGLISVYELPGEVSVAALLYEGPYGELESAVLQLLHWVGMQSYCIAGPIREVHLSGVAHPDGKLTKPALVELQAPIQFAQSAAGFGDQTSSCRCFV